MNKFDLLPENIQNAIDDAVYRKYRKFERIAIGICVTATIGIVGGIAISTSAEHPRIKKTVQEWTPPIIKDNAEDVVFGSIALFGADIIYMGGLLGIESLSKRRRAENYIAELSPASIEIIS